jgi:hypothetical protein
LNSSNAVSERNSNSDDEYEIGEDGNDSAEYVSNGSESVAELQDEEEELQEDLDDIVPEDDDDIEIAPEEMEVDKFLKTHPSVFTTMNVTAVKLDRRLPMKFKRHEFEPLEDAVITNISPASFIPSLKRVDTSRTIPPVKNNVVFDIEAISDYEKMCLEPFFSAGGENVRTDYLAFRNMFIDAYNQDPYSYLSISECEVIAPQLEFLFLCTTHRLLEHSGKINYIV